MENIACFHCLSSSINEKKDISFSGDLYLWNLLCDRIFKNRNTMVLRFFCSFIKCFYQRIENVFYDSASVAFDFTLCFHTGDQTEIVFHIVQLSGYGNPCSVILETAAACLFFQRIFGNVANDPKHRIKEDIGRWEI